MPKSVTVLDTGLGNLHSVCHAVREAGAAVTLIKDAKEITSADALVVPGQGAFGPFMEHMHSSNLVEPLLGYIASGKPYLGICLGMQILFEGSEEAPDANGLGLLSGQVTKFRGDLPIPHMGWNEVTKSHSHPMLDGLSPALHLYFVHSYYVKSDAEVQACSYGIRFSAAIAKDNIYACQFHPEKSQQSGITILENFVRL